MPLLVPPQVQLLQLLRQNMLLKDPGPLLLLGTGMLFDRPTHWLHMLLQLL